MARLNPHDFHRLNKDVVPRLDRTRSQRYIGNLRSDRIALRSLVDEALNLAVGLNTQVEIKEKERGELGIAREPAVKYVNKIQVKIPFEKNELTTEEDVRQYVKALEETYLQQIKERKRIRL